MFDSPIKIIEITEPKNNIYEEASKQIGEAVDTWIWTEIKKLGLYIDKEELIRAMRYERDQYKKGYADGYEDGIKAAQQKQEGINDAGRTTDL